MDALMMNIYVTSQCPRHCPNCYYPKYDMDMTSRTAHDLAIWVGNLCREEKVKWFKAHFLGGEPFERLHIVELLMDGFNFWLPEYTKGHPDGKYVIFTNGDKLDPHELRALKYRKAFLLLNPCNDPLDIVVAKIRTIKEHMHGCSLAICLDAVNMERLPELVKIALDNKCHVRINRLYDGGAIPGYVEAYKAQMHKALDLMLKHPWAMWPNYIMESTYPTWHGPKNPNACGRWLLVIDPNGQVRSCNADMETVIGNISTHWRMSDFQFSHRWSAKDLPECQGCEWITWCQGGCPYTRKCAYGHYAKRTPFCEAFKELFPKVMAIKDRWIKQNGVE